MLDLYALAVTAIAVRTYGMLGVVGIIAVLLIASFNEGDWFRRR